MLPSLFLHSDVSPLFGQFEMGFNLPTWNGLGSFVYCVVEPFIGNTRTQVGSLAEVRRTLPNSVAPALALIVEGIFSANKV